MTEVAQVKLPPQPRPPGEARSIERKREISMAMALTADSSLMLVFVGLASGRAP